ncbi:hypothetical protein ACYCFK_17855 [Stutzerimonas stutzeri]
MKIYQYDEYGYFTGVEGTTTEQHGIPFRFTTAVPPDIPNGMRAILNGDSWLLEDAEPPRTVEDIEEHVASRRRALIGDNNSAYEIAIAQMTADYPASEIATWERQRAEVIAWDEDPEAATPWIDLAASARGLDRTEYLQRTLAKVRAFALASAYLTGRRQGIDDAIRSATSLQALQTIVIDYTLPGSET